MGAGLLLLSSPCCIIAAWIVPVNVTSLLLHLLISRLWWQCPILKKMVMCNIFTISIPCGRRGKDTDMVIQMFVISSVPSVLLLLIRLTPLRRDTVMVWIPTLRRSLRSVRIIRMPLLLLLLMKLTLLLQLLILFHSLGDMLPMKKLSNLTSQYCVLIDIVIWLLLLPLLLVMLLLHVVPMLPRIRVGHCWLHPDVMNLAVFARRGRGGIIDANGIAPQR